MCVCVLGLVGLFGLQGALGADSNRQHSPRDPHVYENNRYLPRRDNKARQPINTPTPATHPLTTQTRATSTTIDGHTTNQASTFASSPAIQRAKLLRQQPADERHAALNNSDVWTRKIQRRDVERKHCKTLMVRREFPTNRHANHPRFEY